MPGKITELSDSDITDLVEEFDSVAAILRYLEMQPSGGNHKSLMGRIEKLGLKDIISKKSRRITLSTLQHKRHDVSALFTENSVVDRAIIKREFIATLSIEQRCCFGCGIQKWQNQNIVLQLDHVNGVNNDNRRENLRLLCPNCHSQTDTYAGKNTRLRVIG